MKYRKFTVESSLGIKTEPMNRKRALLYAGVLLRVKNRTKECPEVITIKYAGLFTTP
jgi:hypothetical protein